ncbi:hypothetical protein PALA111701_24935 [Paenibacillus lactis]
MEGAECAGDDHDGIKERLRKLAHIEAMRIIDDLAFDQALSAKPLDNGAILIPLGSLNDLDRAAERNDLVVMEILIHIPKRVCLQHAVRIQRNDDI